LQHIVLEAGPASENATAKQRFVHYRGDAYEEEEEVLRHILLEARPARVQSAKQWKLLYRRTTGEKEVLQHIALEARSACQV
jgi:hypothetical protein